jgi:hypothetical protein
MTRLENAVTKLGKAREALHKRFEELDKKGVNKLMPEMSEVKSLPTKANVSGNKLPKTSGISTS